MDPDSEINRLADALNVLFREFCEKAGISETIGKIFEEINFQLTSAALVDFALYLIPRLDAYLNLKLALWAGGYGNQGIANYIEKHSLDTQTEIERRFKLLDIEIDSHKPQIKEWFDRFKTETTLHASTSVPLIQGIKSLLSGYLPNEGRSQAAIDEALSAVGLPTSTENEESWLKRLAEKPY